MTNPDLFSEFQEMINSKDPQVTALLHRLAEQSAMIKDQEINNDLLQELIVKYSLSAIRPVCIKLTVLSIFMSQTDIR